MASGSWAREALSAGMAMTRDELAPGYLRAHDVGADPPATLPGTHGETVTLYRWTPEDEAAMDWRVIV